MELFGKVVSPNRGGLNLNGNEELLVNAKSNRVTLSAALLSKLNVADKAVGFGYDPEQKLGAPAFIYVMDNVEEGCKVGTSGTVTSKFHSDMLADAFKAELNGANRFKLDVNVENTVAHESGVTLYPVTFLETLADITRSKSTTTAEAASEASNEPMDLEATNEAEVPMEPVAETEATQWGSQNPTLD